MSERDEYQPGVPCWVDVLVSDPARVVAFYGELFGWEFDGPGPGDYYVARVRGRDVAGVGAAPEGVPPAWNTNVGVRRPADAARAAQAAGARIVMEPFDVLPAGRLAVLEDPSGAPIGLWQAADRQGAQVLNEPSAWAMSLLHTRESDASEAFYREAFGWQTEPFGPPGLNLFRLPGYVGGEPAQPVPRDVVAVMAPLADEAMPAHWQVDFWVHDADALAARAPELGGRVLAPPFDAGGMRQTVLADPFGAVFSVTTAPGPH
jgi:predicted enzyme related to lactoylglutathione lyase